MKSPTLIELPAPPVNKTGWPWTTESQQIDITMDNGKIWPKISVVTPSFNQAQFIEETIRSVLLQRYPNLEYIIIDGGSTDGSTEIIRKYEPWISYWVSEPDNGQSEAINKGWRCSKGDILAWLNSDDTYEINALQEVANLLVEKSDISMVYGDCNIIDETGQFVMNAPTKSYDFKSLICNEWFIPQQSTFIRQEVFNKVGKLNEDLHLVMDWEYWSRIALKEFEIYYFTKTLANFRQYDGAKTFSQHELSAEEKLRVLNNFFNNSEIEPKISAFRNDAYSHIHKFACSAYNKTENDKKAFYHLIKSIKYKPANSLDKIFIKRFIIYIIGRSRCRKFRNYLSFLVNLKSKKSV